MTKPTAHFRAELKKQIERDTRVMPWMMVFATVVFPIIEAILVAVWVAEGHPISAGISLLAIATLHVLLGSFLIYNEFRARSPLRVLADAADLADEVCNTQHELDRRVKTYRMFREAIDEMNAQVCTIQETLDAFDDSLRPILKRFLNAICDTIGVCSNRYTLEVYIASDMLPPQERLKGEYTLVFFDGPTVASDKVIELGAAHPLCIASKLGRERLMGQVSEKPDLFRSDQPLYFEQYVVHAIPTQCETGDLGYVVFTTAQKEPLLPDALETIGLIASVTSSFHSRWTDCERYHELWNELDDAIRRANATSEVKPRRAQPLEAPTESAHDEASGVRGAQQGPPFPR